MLGFPNTHGPAQGTVLAARQSGFKVKSLHFVAPQNLLGRPLGYLIFSLMALIRDPIY